MEEIEKQIVDDGLKQQIRKQVDDAGSLKDAFERGIYLLDKHGKPHGNRIRHIRVWASVSEPLAIKKQTNLSDADYKQYYWAANGENIICAYYKNDTIEANGKLKKNRDLEIINLNDAAKLKSFGLVDKKGNIEIYRKNKDGQVLLDSNGKKESPYTLLKVALKVIFFDANIEELKQKIDEPNGTYSQRISSRLYKIVKFAGGQVTFQHHLDSRDEKQHMEAYPENSFFKKDIKGNELTYGKRGKNGFTEKISDYVSFNNNTPWHKLLYTKDWLDFAVEGKDFIINMDGTIRWI